MTAWLRDMTAHVKALDPAHMVSAGGVGYRLAAPDPTLADAHAAAASATSDAHLENMARPRPPRAWRCEQALRLRVRVQAGRAPRGTPPPGRTRP